jgi:hypothetical protein
MRNFRQTLILVAVFTALFAAVLIVMLQLDPSRIP